MPYDGSYRFTQRFGSNKAAYARFGMSGHNGLDIGLPSRTPLKAVRAGDWWMGNDPTGYGRYGVLTDDEGTQWLYGHLYSARAAGSVAEGDEVGLSDNTGNSTGNHLHFGMRRAAYDPNNGYLGYTNPRPYLPLHYHVCLQHAHTPDGGGAPGEAEWTVKLSDALAAYLNLAGVEVTISGGFFNQPAPAELGVDYDLYLALHYDARFPDSYTTGCCIARGDYETEPWEADRFIAGWVNTYPSETGVPLKQSRVGVNMTQYYAWRHLTYVTPGVLIEHGVGAPGVGADADLLWNHLGAVVRADGLAITSYLGIRSEVTDMAILSDEELYEAANKVWGELRSVPCDKNSGFYKSWAATLKAGDYKGLPVAGELGTTFGTVQCFDRGMVVWKPGQEVSWEG